MSDPIPFCSPAPWPCLHSGCYCTQAGWPFLFNLYPFCVGWMLQPGHILLVNAPPVFPRLWPTIPKKVYGNSKWHPQMTSLARKFFYVNTVDPQITSPWWSFSSAQIAHGKFFGAGFFLILHPLPVVEWVDGWAPLDRGPTVGGLVSPSTGKKFWPFSMSQALGKMTPFWSPQYPLPGWVQGTPSGS